MVKNGKDIGKFSKKCQYMTKNMTLRPFWRNMQKYDFYDILSP